MYFNSLTIFITLCHISFTTVPFSHILFRQAAVIALLLLCRLPVIAQDIPENKYGLKVVASIEAYNLLAAKDSSNLLVRLKDIIPDIYLDIRYATKNNFTGKVLYPSAEAWLRLPAAKALAKAAAGLRANGLMFKIWDAYRPYRVTETLWEYVQDDRYAADPKKGSRHNRGCAVDITLVNLHDGSELPMPTEYDDFSKKAFYEYTALPEHVLINRGLLRKTMEEAGFVPLSSEWWHFDFSGWGKYPLLDIPFSGLNGR